MSRRTRNLEDRQAALLQRCAAERDEVAGETAMLRTDTLRIDREIGRLQRWAVHPVVIGTGVVLAYFLVRSRPMRAMGTALALLPPILRFATAGRRIHRQVRHVP